MTVHLWPEVREVPISRRRFGDDKFIAGELGFIPKSYPQDTVVGCSVEDGHKVFLIRSGWGCLSSALPDGDRQIIDFPLKGDLIISRGYQDDASEIFTARTELVVLEVSAGTFFSRLTASPSLGGAFWGAVTRQRAILAQHFTSVGSRRALARLAHLLLELSVRLEQIGETTEGGYKCPLTQIDFADALGLTVIHVNRVLRELRERELVEVRHGAVRFLNKSALERIAAFDSTYLE